MAFPLPFLARIALVIALAWSMTPIPQQQVSAEAAEEHASLRPEVRLRKLHLVRPDLIPYPIAYEVCC
jgi:hypothetical protein